MRILKRIIWSLLPVVALLLAGEVVVRLRYFFYHKHDWNYITMPFRVQDIQGLDHAFYKAPETTPPPPAAAPAPAKLPTPAAAPAPSPASAPSPVPASAPAKAPAPAPMPAPVSPPAPGVRKAAAAPPPAPAPPPPPAAPAPPAPSAAPVATVSSAPDAPSSAQMNFKWVRPCQDREVFSAHYNKPMPYTWDANCFRGDSVKTTKSPGEIRIFVVGGSTVEDAQPDVDTWTMRLKAQLADPRVRVVNAGQTAMGSNSMVAMYESKLSLFKPDIVLYYEAWNEQTPFGQLRVIDQRLGQLSNRMHKLLHYRSMLYTYLVEKYNFMTTADVKFWRIDVDTLQQNLDRLSNVIDHSGGRMVFVTQAIRFPRYWKGVDTFDPNAVDALLERLRKDKSYAYDTEEISCLNQRLAVFRSIEVCRRKDVPVINLLDDVEALGDEGRKPIFVDMGHLTWQGDAFVGKLVGEKLAALHVM